MPELPEVETMCRCIAAAAGGRIRDVVRPPSRLQSISISPRLDHFRRRAVGRRIAAVRRVGKRVVIELDARDGECPHPSPLPAGEGNGEPADCIVLEPRMTGLVLLADPPDQKHVPLVFRLAGSRARQIIFWDQRGLGVAKFLTPEQFLADLRAGPAGARCLDDFVADLAAAIGRQPPGDQSGPVGPARRGRHRQPLRLRNPASGGHSPGDSLPPAPPAQWSKLHAAMGVVLQAAIRHQGSTLRDGTYRIARNKPGDYQVFHRVYQRAGEACLRCGAGRSRANRPGPAVDLLLSRLPAAL